MPSDEKPPFHVLLISPPPRRIKFNISGLYPMQPLGLACLAAYLRSRRVSVSILDAVRARLSLRETARAALARSPSVIGISATIFNLVEAQDLAREIKKTSPETIIVVGGNGVVFSPEILVGEMEAVDYFIAGEGEEAFRSLAENLMAGREPDDTPGLIWKKKNAICSNPQAERLVLDDLPLPALDLLPPKGYSMHPPFNVKPPICLVETARGCGWGCNFCSLPRSLRQKSVGRVVEEIAWAGEVFSAREVHFVDPTFTADAERLGGLAEAVGREFPELSWSCKSRVDLIDEGTAESLGRNGCYLVSLGLESGSQRMLDALSKETTVAQIRRSAAALKRFGVGLLAYVVFGAPGETEETVAETMSLLNEIKADYVLFAPLMPDPLCELVAREMAKGAFGERDIFRLYYTGSPEGTPFAERSFTGLPTRLLDRWVRKAYLRYYAKPSYVARRLLAARSPREMRNLAAGAMSLLRDALAGPDGRSIVASRRRSGK